MARRRKANTQYRERGSKTNWATVLFLAMSVVGRTSNRGPNRVSWDLVYATVQQIAETLGKPVGARAESTVRNALAHGISEKIYDADLSMRNISLTSKGRTTVRVSRRIIREEEHPNGPARLSALANLVHQGRGKGGTDTKAQLYMKVRVLEEELGRQGERPVPLQAWPSQSTIADEDFHIVTPAPARQLTPPFRRTSGAMPLTRSSSMPSVLSPLHSLNPADAYPTPESLRRPIQPFAPHKPNLPPAGQDPVTPCPPRARSRNTYQPYDVPFVSRNAEAGPSRFEDRGGLSNQVLADIEEIEEVVQHREFSPVPGLDDSISFFAPSHDPPLSPPSLNGPNDMVVDSLQQNANNVATRDIEGDITALQEQFTGLHDQLQKTKDELNKVVNTSRNLSQRCLDLNRELLDSTIAMTQKDDQINDMEKDIGEKNQAIGALTINFLNMCNQLQDNLNRIAQLEAQNDTLQTAAEGHANTEQELLAKNTQITLELHSLRTQLENVQGNLSNAETDLEREVATLKQEIVDARQSLGQSNDRYVELLDKVAKKDEEIVKLQLEVQEGKEKLQKLVSDGQKQLAIMQQMYTSYATCIAPS
ncbi:hypothetical protein C8Q75DRAFT_805189 [Abortiporus biennis]|nr:hypothetical protein C8Q75DRAFT_805189 [Abortiporus biennis]